jgi:putative glutamine amidotransferase
MTRPVIAVAFPKSDYLAAIEKAGAVPRTLSPEDVLPGALEGCDGVLLTGGVDVDPAEYGEPMRHASVETDPVRDRYELALAREAMARDLPLLAICRGAQVLNVAAGGTLFQDLPSQRPSAIEHTIEQPKDAVAHPVRVLPETRLAALLGSAAPDVSVNSRHHQAVRDVARGFVVAATAPDGVIEAIEKPDAAFCVGVQWHPENFWRTGEFSTLFDGFVDAARATSARARRSPSAPARP